MKTVREGAGVRGTELAGLCEAVEQEREAASRLAGELGRAREAAQRLDVDGMGVILARARRAMDDLARAGGQRARLAEGLARALDVSPDTPLERLGALVGQGAGLVGAAEALREGLYQAARASSALSICTRYAGVVAGQLATFASGGACYGPGGRLHADPRVVGRRA